MSNHYDTLGVTNNATPDEIKRAYRKLASQHHPDKGGDTAMFQRVEEAYRILSDPEKRAAYDNPAPKFGNFDFQFNNINDIFNMFGQQGFGGQHPRRNHVRMSLYISLHDVATGGRRTVNVSTPTGSQTVEIDIPLGLNDSDNVQYSGIAPGGLDLVVTFRIQPSRQFQRNGLDLTAEQTVSIWDLVTGSDVSVRNIFGEELVIRIPARTQPGTLMRLRSQGLPDRHGRRGDMFVKIAARIPDSIPQELVEAIQKHRQ